MSGINEDDQQFVFLFYKPSATEEDTKKSPCKGVVISKDNAMYALSENEAAVYRNYIWKQFDLTSCKRISRYFSKDAYTMGVNFSWTQDIASDNGSGSVRGGSLTLKSLTVTGDSVDLVMDARLKYVPTFYDATTPYGRLISRYGQLGDVFYLSPEARWPVFYPALRKTSSNTEVICYSTEIRDTLYCMYVDFSNPSNSFNFNLNSEGNGYYRAVLTKSVSLDSQSVVFLFFKSETDDSDSSYLLSPYDVVNLAASDSKIGLSFSYSTIKEEHLASSDIPANQLPAFSLSEMVYPYTGLKLSVPISSFSESSDGSIEVSVSFYASDSSGTSLGEQNGTFRLRQIIAGDDKNLSLYKEPSSVQYLQRAGYRARINTLFARQLISQAEKGIDAVLSMETQKLPEPKPGAGSYVDVIFNKYSAALHGEGWYILYMVGAEIGRIQEPVASGYVSEDSETIVRVFLPYNSYKIGDEKNMIFLGVEYSDYEDGLSSYKTMQCYTYNASTGEYEDSFSDDMSNQGRTRGLSSHVAGTDTEPMDFSGANALYFWEMFFYVPSMVFLRLLQEGSYTEATRWMKFIWSPDGYIGNNGEKTTWTWNVRPLEEDTSWNAFPLDSVDPDAVAQSDPMHYKVATFMRALDLLLARGDEAYRKLERDSLNEAKMWYAQALSILGDEPYDVLLKGGWTDPVLSDAASQTLQDSYHLQMLWVRAPDLSGAAVRTANSLLGLFYPQQNKKLTGYWQTLAQRMYNLRHNLSIDGLPLSLPLYATPADPAALLSTAVLASEGGLDLPSVTSIPLYRFPVLLETARTTLNQLTQFGNLILNFTERQDAEALSELLQNQGAELAQKNIQQQDRNIAEIDADREALEENRKGAQKRRDSYSRLYEENVNSGETQAMELYLSSSVMAAVGTGLQMGAAALDMVPNIYGLAVGGSRYGALFNAFAIGTQIASDGTRIAADKISQSEMYRRRRQEWEIQRNSADAEIKLIDSQLVSLAIRREAAVLQKSLVEMQQAQTQAQQVYLQNKFSNKALYNWLRGKLAGIYYQFYDIAVTRCLMAQRAWQWRFNDNATSFIRPGAWQGTYAGLLSGETLMMNLAQMEQAWYTQEARLLEVNKTVSLSAVYNGLSSGAFSFTDKITEIINAGNGSAGSGGNTVEIASGQLVATMKLSDLNIRADYPETLGEARRIKQISVTLPAMVGPYQDVRAVLSYGGSVVLPNGCSAIVVSHGMNDSGCFQLDFNDPQNLPFEGIPVDDTGSLVLSFPDISGKQKALLLSLSDIIVHIRYTIGQ